MKQGYFVSSSNDGLGFAVVAVDENEAKALAWNADGEDWRRKDIECHCLPDANIDGLPIGMVTDEYDALCRGMYDFLWECECDECKQDADLTCYEGRALCEYCIWEMKYGDEE